MNCKKILTMILGVIIFLCMISCQSNENFPFKYYHWNIYISSTNNLIKDTGLDYMVYDQNKVVLLDSAKENDEAILIQNEAIDTLGLWEGQSAILYSDTEKKLHLEILEKEIPDSIYVNISRENPIEIVLKDHGILSVFSLNSKGNRIGWICGRGIVFPFWLIGILSLSAFILFFVLPILFLRKAKKIWKFLFLLWLYEMVLFFIQQKAILEDKWLDSNHLLFILLIWVAVTIVSWWGKRVAEELSNKKEKVFFVIYSMVICFCFYQVLPAGKFFTYSSFSGDDWFTLFISVIALPYLIIVFVLYRRVFMDTRENDFS